MYQRQSEALSAHISELIKTVFAVRFRCVLHSSAYSCLKTLRTVRSCLALSVICTCLCVCVYVCVCVFTGTSRPRFVRVSSTLSVTGSTWTPHHSSLTHTSSIWDGHSVTRYARTG